MGLFANDEITILACSSSLISFSKSLMVFTTRSCIHSAER
nr:MAG TPA: hypothetical protein [Caudoviricetes sp.]DAN69065.1 MAG TPA: hypothetical protein [Caudoviricetes sp.]